MLAVPVAPPETLARFVGVADEVVCLETPPSMLAIGEWYGDFSQTSDEEVAALLERAVARSGGRAEPAGALDTGGEVRVGSLGLPGSLTVPPEPLGVVVFAHGSGSSRHSPRNRAVADALVRRGLATLLFDLLTPDEEATQANVFDIELLGRRLVDVTRRLAGQPMGRAACPSGISGSSDGPVGDSACNCLNGVRKGRAEAAEREHR